MDSCSAVPINNDDGAMGVGMWNHLCVYNPDLGDEETVEKQLVYTQGTTDFVKLIGLTQGIAELAHAFGNEPAKWFETSGARPETVVVVPLETHSATKNSNWRSGLWFAGQYSSSADSLPPLAAYRSVEVAFSQHRLHWGPPSQNTEYWAAFGNSTASWDLGLTSMVAPAAIRLAPGTFNPEIARSVDKLAKKNGALDLLITLDGAAVYSGSNLDFTTRREVQRWLARTDGTTAHKASATYGTIADTTNDTTTTDTTNGATAGTTVDTTMDTSTADAADNTVDTAVDTSTGDAKNGTAADTSTANAPTTDAVTDTIASGATDTATDPAAWAWNVPKLSQYIPFGLPFSVPSFKSLPDPLRLTPWWSSEEPADVPDGVLAENVELFDGDRKIYATVWRQGLFVYTAVFASSQNACTITELLLDPVVTQMEGFSFAFAPPARFYYLVLSPDGEITSTFPDLVETEVLRTLLAGLPDEQQIVRLGSTWLYFSRMSNGAKAVFGKKNVATQPSLLGALHSDVQQWIDNYERTHSRRESPKNGHAEH